MCGIVGLFLKKEPLQHELGSLLSRMLVTLSDRGPDSAGLAIFGSEHTKKLKVTIQSTKPEEEFQNIEQKLRHDFGIRLTLQKKDSHAVLTVNQSDLISVKKIIKTFKNVRLMSVGTKMEIYKEIGFPDSVVQRFSFNTMTGSHGIGHTRMATESAVTTLGAHPFSTGQDQCLVHNGSLSNHNKLKRKLTKSGIHFETDNDTEVAAAYLSCMMHNGKSLEDALKQALDDLDGFYTFVVGTKDGFAVLRDPIACKPAVLAETDEYVAFGSEYKALSVLPKIDTAKVWEPEPAQVYFWSQKQ